MAIEFTVLAASLLSQAQTLLPAWLPAGRLRGHEFVCGDLSGKPGDSLSINVNTGRWSDFATGEVGGDLISLYAAMHQLSQGDAVRQLSHAVPVLKQQKKRTVVAPVPAGAPACPCVHKEHGKPTTVWQYRDAAGELLGYVARYDLPGKKKEVIPWTFDGSRWGMGAWPEPRPLYGLDDLARRPDAPVLLVEGEKSADAARKLAHSYVVVTWPGGSKAWRKADWSQLRGRAQVLLWPDADIDGGGMKAMWGIGNLLMRQCREVKMIDPDPRLGDGWDAADAVQAGWDWQRFKEWALPRVTVVTEGGTYASSRAAASAAADRGSGNGSHGNRGLGVQGPEAAAVPAQSTSNGQAPAPQSRYARWMAWGLDRSGNGDALSNINNAVLVLDHDPSWQGCVWYDEFLQRVLTRSNPHEREWIDADDINLTVYMQRVIGLTKISTDIVAKAVTQVARSNVRNCVRDWFESLEWDQEPRIDHFFEDHFGAAGTPYVRAVSKNFWISMVARGYRPGCQVDNVVVLEGGQGKRKSSALRVIGGSWFSEQHAAASDAKAFAENIQGKLLIEISEMDSFQRAELTRVKQVITCTNDRYRNSYGHRAEDHPRQCVFVCTTNRNDWNKDETGARRFWPIRTNGAIDTDAIARHRSQFFAEAVARFKAHESWWQTPDEETRAEQQKRFDADVWLDEIQAYVGLKTEITVNELLTDCLRKTVSEITPVDQKRVTACLRAMAWDVKVERYGRHTRRVWRAGE